jgi:hypothetical protein
MNTQQRTPKALRPRQVYAPEGPLPCRKTQFFSDYVLKDEADPYIPNTKVRRLRLARLSARMVVAFEDEVNDIVEGLRAERDTKARRGD